MPDFAQLSYEQHVQHLDPFAQGGDQAVRSKKWVRRDTVFAWRHRRFYAMLDPLLSASPKARWLTIGDGMYGNDARYILEKGCEALPTDIAGHLLREAKSSGWIPDFRQENAEALSFESESFDYVLCKESLHHFPRPMIALYEMLRVAAEGVVLIEPQDRTLGDSFLAGLRRCMSQLVTGPFRKHAYEKSGNYVYAMSKREVEKVALGLDYPLVAFKCQNDCYLDGVEDAVAEPSNRLFQRLQKKLAARNFWSRIGFQEYNQLTAVIFKVEPAAEVLAALKADGYELRRLTRNPYIQTQRAA